MHLRSPACKGSPTSEQQGPHAPHGYWTRHYLSWLECPGWTESEATAAAAVEQVRAYGMEHPAPDGARLEAHPGVLAGISQLLTPDYPGEGDGIGHQITQLFGVALTAAPLSPGEWRLVTEGTVRDG